MRIPGLDLAVLADDAPWRETSVPGVAWLPLHLVREDGGPRQDSAVLIRMEPGRGYPPHRHLDVEEVLILAGGYRDEAGENAGEHRAGTYLRYEAGSVHAPVALGDPERSTGTDNPACVLFAVARGGIEIL